MMKERHLKALELEKILTLCASYAISDEAKEKTLDIWPEETYEGALHQQAQTRDANELSVRFGNPTITAVKPCQSIVGRAERSAQLSTRELLDTAALLRCARTLGTWYDSAADGRTSLEPLFEALTPNQSLENEIARCILSEDEIADDASAELSNIRRKIRNSQSRARESLEKITRSNTYQKYLQEQIITIRNGRFVVPVRAEHRGEIKGLVHDTSSSGATLFVEPMAVVELNNQIRELEVAQQTEINHILLDLSGQVADCGDPIRSNYEIIVLLDVIFAKSKLGDSMQAISPTLIRDGEMVLGKARHPLISKDQIVPIDISIGGAFDTLVITGPNTGGKTVAIKTLGLLTLMSLCGLMIPASSRSKVRFYENILADIGDEQSIEQSLSTFSGHMTNIVGILKEANEHSLVLIDELGAGTDPVEGAALAVAIISQLREQKAHILGTTHYAEMKIFALQTPGVENASCEFDVATLRPTYRLLIGTPGRSNAFAISQRLGMPQSIITAAEELVSSENRRFEDVVTSLDETRQALEQERKQAQNLRQQAATAKDIATTESKDLKEQQEKILEDTHQRSRTILERVRFQADHILDELESLKKQKDKANFSQTFSKAQGRIRGLLDEMEDVANPVVEKSNDYTLPRQLVRGDIVFLADFNTEGTVVSPPDNKGNLMVKAGILDMKVSESRVRLLDKSNKKVTFNSGAIRTKQAVKNTDSSGTSKLDLRGLDSSEAKMELDRFLDRSVLQHLKTVTIVHGKGTGVLRDMVQQALRQSRQVENYRLGGYGEGGDGATIVELK